MNRPVVRTNPDAPFATLIRTARTYCHPEADGDAYDNLKHVAKREDIEEMIVFKKELRDAIICPGDVPKDHLYNEVQYDDGSAEKFLRRLWRDLYPDEPVPGDTPS